MKTESTDNDYTVGRKDGIEAAAKLVEEELFPNPINQYHVQYNDGIRRKAQEIRNLK